MNTVYALPCGAPLIKPITNIKAIQMESVGNEYRMEKDTSLNGCDKWDDYGNMKMEKCNKKNNRIEMNCLWTGLHAIEIEYALRQKWANYNNIQNVWMPRHTYIQWTMTHPLHIQLYGQPASPASASLSIWHFFHVWSLFVSVYLDYFIISMKLFPRSSKDAIN